MRSSESHRSESFDVSSSYMRGEKAIDLHKEGASRTSKSIRINAGGTTMNLDVNVWLPKAAEIYGTSKDIRDYIVVPVVANISELPNTNGDGFSTQEWVRFNPDQGKLAFQTFQGKPTFIEHANQDYTKAKGVILDSALTPLKGFRGNHSKLTLLLSFDRTRAAERCGQILRNEVNTYSKGTTYKAYRCSICGHVVTASKRQFCSHTYFNKPTYMIGDKLAYRDCLFLTGFECSSVDDPAFACAATYHDHLMQVK